MRIAGREMVWEGFWARAGRNTSWKWIVSQVAFTWLWFVFGSAIAWGYHGTVWAWALFGGLPAAVLAFWIVLGFSKWEDARRATPRARCARDSDWCDGRLCRERGIDCPNADPDPKP